MSNVVSATLYIILIRKNVTVSSVKIPLFEINCKDECNNIDCTIHLSHLTTRRDTGVCVSLCVNAAQSI